ncbi:MAG: hypothetical protein AAGA17_00230 [Actinomycetota bacterium]
MKLIGTITEVRARSVDASRLSELEHWVSVGATYVFEIHSPERDLWAVGDSIEIEMPE